MATTTIWSPIAILVGIGFVLSVVILIRALAKSRIVATSSEECAEMATLPMTPLQKRAWWGLSIGLAMALACVAVIARAGPEAYFEDGDARLLVLAFIMTALLSHLAVLIPTRVGLGVLRSLDERDRKVLAGAPQYQVAAGLLTVAAWMIALTESYRGTPGVPRGFLYLIFWSVFVAQTVAHSAGILAGYYLARNHAEG